MSAELALKVNVANQQALIEKQNISIAPDGEEKMSEIHNRKLMPCNQYEDTHEECANLKLQVNELNYH